MVGLFVAAYLFYQKQTIMKQAYQQLSYVPNEQCPCLTCSNLDPFRLNFAITVAVFGGLGLFFPLTGLLALVCLIISLVSKIISCCQRPQSNPTL